MTGISEYLRSTCDAEWKAAHRDHPFVKAMGDGTLSLERFQFFMRQDYLFLVDYARVIGIAAAKSPDLASMGQWAGLLDETLNSEMDLHRGFCADFGITVDDLEATEAAPATVAYTGHLVRTAFEGDILQIAAALLPCQWGYDEIGRTLEKHLTAPAGSFHARWVAGYTAPEYRQFTTWLRGFTDDLGRSASERQKAQMLSVFKSSTYYEHLFWDAAWSMQDWSG